MYIKILSVIILACFPFISGCWDIEEINNRATINALYVDEGNPQKVKLGASFNVPGTLVPPTVGSPGATRRDFTTFAEGDGLLEAWSKLQANSNRPVYFGQLDAVVLSDKIARQEISNVLDFLGRMEPVPNDIFVLVTKSNPQKLFEMKNQANIIPGSYIKSFFQSKDKRTLALPSYQWNVLETTDNGTSDPYVAMIEPSQNMYTIAGTALFSKNRMVGDLNMEETQTLAWLKGSSNGYLTLPIGENSIVGFINVDAKSKIVPEIDAKGVLTFSVKTDISGSIYETNPRKLGITRKDQLEFEKIAQNYTKNHIDKLLTKLQDLNSDPIGFGEKFRIKYPLLWEKTDWHEVYPNARFKVKTSFSVKRTGLFR